MKGYKDCEVVMLPTKNKSDLAIINIPDPTLCSSIQRKEGQLYTKETYPLNVDTQHLYVISNDTYDKIKEGDWVLNHMMYIRGEYYVEEATINHTKYNGWKKIIATTDESIRFWTDNENGKHIWSYPRLSQEFINEYIEYWNNSPTGSIIKKVFVEMNEKCCKCDTYEQESKCSYSVGDIDGSCSAPNPNDDFYGLLIKVNSTDNTINIKTEKNSWNRDEVVELLLNCCGEVSCEDGTLLGKTPAELYLWIEENV